MDMPGSLRLHRAVEDFDRTVFWNDRETLVLSCLILDTRRGWMEKDLDLKRLARALRQAVPGISTKTDKLNQIRADADFAPSAKEGVEPLAFSALRRPGSEEIWQQSRNNQLR